LTYLLLKSYPKYKIDTGKFITHDTDINTKGQTELFAHYLLCYATNTADWITKKYISENTQNITELQLHLEVHLY